MIMVEFGSPDYVKFKDALHKLRWNQRLCYHKGLPMLIEAREHDECLHKMANLVWTLQELDYAMLYQIRAGRETYYCIHPRSYSTPKGRKKYINRKSILEAELIISRI